jgi:dephospho-CoA kinase
MLIIGLTGGIGSGKSAASALFEELGVHVVDADVVAREVVEPGSLGLENIAKHFGQDILDSCGKLNRSKLREVIFRDNEEKKWLEALLHPLIRTEIIKQLEQASSPYVILVSPLLFETDQHLLCTRTLLIDASEELQIARASKRDSTNEDAIKKIIASQMPREEKQQKADDIILNDNNEAHLKAMVDFQHHKYLELTKGRNEETVNR